MKVTIIGAGNVGATLAKRVLESGLSGCVLLDVVKGLARGKALDLMHAAPILGYQNRMIGSDNYKDAEDSDIVVVTAGKARQPGMSRADLVSQNGRVIKDVVKKVKAASPGAILIIVTNPLDIMTFLAYKESGFSPKRVLGMAGVLDAARFVHIIAEEMKVKNSDVETLVLGQHGPDMVPLISHTRVSGRPIKDLIPKERIEELVEKLRGSGAEIVKLLGSGSAYYAPSAACFRMICAIVKDDKKILSVSCIPDGKYGLQQDVSIGLPVRLGKDGIAEIVELKIDACEADALKKSAENIKSLTKELWASTI